VIAWNINHIVRRNGGTRFPTVAVGEGWNELWALLTGTLGAHGGELHVTMTTGEALDWLLDQPEFGLA
jgi:hypothetical protein